VDDDQGTSRVSEVQSEAIDRGRVVDLDGAEFGLFDEVLEDFRLDGSLVGEEALEVGFEFGLSASQEVGFEVAEEAFLGEGGESSAHTGAHLLVEIVQEAEAGAENPLLGSLLHLDLVQHVLLVNDLGTEQFNFVLGLGMGLGILDNVFKKMGTSLLLACSSLSLRSTLARVASLNLF
jgi:hypothetical protein